ncbi:unnamed protein product [Schistosoma turkestanicum]|nr:unnamed protein product [Schistosoma turkestanicum]
MDKGTYSNFDKWSSRMVSGVEFRCKVRVPIIADLPTLNEISSQDFEYDFLHERQVIADFEDYFKAKKDSEKLPPTSVCESPLDQPNPLQKSVKQGIELPHNVHVSDRQSLSSNNLCPSSVSMTPPPAASHLVSGRILEPSIIDSGASSQPCKSEQTKIPGDKRECSGTDLIHSSSASPTICTYLKDFDIQPDDPFTMTELKTINELEELRKILMHDSVLSSCQPQSHHLTTTDIINNDSEGSSIINYLDTHFVNSKNLSYPFSSSQYKYETANSFQNKSGGFINNPKSDHKVQKHAQEVAISNGFHDSSEVGNAPTKFTKLSAPFLNSCVPCGIKSNAVTEQPQALSGISERDYFMNSEKYEHILKTTSTGAGNFDSHHSQLKLLESLLPWATSCGFSHSHARRLLELGVQKTVFTGQNLEQNKLILLNLLHTFNSLLTTFSTNQNSHKLSEQSALLITITYPNDLSKAQQLARLVFDLEQNGFSQDIICHFIQNPHSIKNETVAKLLNNLMTSTNTTVRQVSPVVNFSFSKPCSMKSPEK